MKTFLTGVRKARGMSLAGLAEVLGYKSQTSLVRIEQDKANVESVEKFARLMKESKALALDEDEVAALDRILERKRLTSEEYAASVVLRRFLQEDVPGVDPVLVHVDNEEQQTLLQRYMGMEDVKITLVNCQNVPLYGALAQLARTGRARIEHYLYAEEDLLSTTISICSVLPILYEKNYYCAMAYADREELFTKPRGIMRADVMLCEYQRHGSLWYDLVIFQDAREGRRFTYPGSGETVHRMLEELIRRAEPIRHSAKEIHRDYIAYLSYCLELEWDRPVYRIKPDLGLEQVPVHILRRAMEEGPGGSRGLGNIAALEKAMHLRQQNACTKHQAQHHVMKPRAMWRFTRTGRLSDQFWAFRALTVQERMETLQFVLEQHTKNPYCQFHFLKDEDAMRDEEYVCYDGLGLSIIKAGTNYDLRDDHCETMITHPEFLRIYRNFFLHSVLDYQVLPEARTRRLLREMIAYCQANLTE